MTSETFTHPLKMTTNACIAGYRAALTAGLLSCCLVDIEAGRSGIVGVHRRRDTGYRRCQKEDKCTYTRIMIRVRSERDVTSQMRHHNNGNATKMP